MTDSTHPVEVPAPRRRRRRKLGWMLLIGSLLAGGASVAGWRATHPAQQRVDPALVVTAARTSLAVEVVDVGRIEAVNTVEIESRIPGRVLEVRVDEGDTVTAGQLLVRLDRREALRAVSRAGTELSRAKARSAFAGNSAARQERGAAQGLVSQVDLEAAQQERALAVLDQRLARVVLADARDQLRYTEISAPIGGTVTRRAIEPGEMVKPGVQSSFESVSLLTIADLSRLVVKTELSQIDVAKVRLGQRVLLRLDALPGEKLAARITKIAPASVRPAGKDVEVFPVEAELEHADPRVKPGMTADVRIAVGERPNVLALPLESVRREHDESFVSRVVSDERGEHTERVKITLGAENDREVEVVSGIAEGERVLIDPPSAAENETKI
jgi:macrolide-specific efflux system membrane fusion protein